MAAVKAGDLVFCHRHGLVPAVIRLGQRLRSSRANAQWSHVAIVTSLPGDDRLCAIEALSRRVTVTPLETFDRVEHEVVPSHLEGMDLVQALAFARSCVGQKYGWTMILGIALRYLTPGRGLWFGANGTEICSGLCAQALVRGFYNFPYEPASMTPAELRENLP